MTVFKSDGIIQDFVELGDVAREQLGQQCQYAVRYVDGFQGEYPNCGEGLRFHGDTDNYHFLLIHRDDVEEFVRRVRQAKKERGW